MAEMIHTHRIVPGHLGGTYNPENTIKLTVAEHAAWHYELWVYYGFKQDWLAWKGLTGEIKNNELHLEKCRLGGLNSKGRIKSPEECKKLANSWTTERKQQLANLAKFRFTGMPKSPKHIENMKQPKTFEHIENMKQTLRQNTKGKSIITPFGTFDTIKGAARTLNLDPMTIKYRAQHNIKGYSFNG